MRATSDGTMIAADAPARAWARITQPTDGAKIIRSAETAKTATTTRNTRTQPSRWPIFAPTMTRAATTRPYVTIAVLTSVGGTRKSATMPPRDTGRAETL